MQIWLVEDQKLKQLAPDEVVNALDSAHVYLVEYTEHKQSSLYAWFEGTVYIWVGTEVAERKNTLLSALERAKTLGTASKTVRRYISPHHNNLMICTIVINSMM